MMVIDLLMIAVILTSAVSAFLKGLLVELFSLAGAVVGFMIAAADYGLLAPRLMGWVKNSAAADLVAFLLIALGVMFVMGLIGRFLRSAIRWAGLGLLDGLLGGFFGVVKGCALVTLAMMAMAAFFPDASWPRSSRLMPWFLSAAHEGSHMTPALGEKIREGIRELQMAQPHS